MESIIKQWKDPIFRGTEFWFFMKVNAILRNVSLNMTSTDIKMINFQSIQSFKEYTSKYINKLSKIIYDDVNKLNKPTIFYRGENRHFSHKIGDILPYNQFTSVASELSYAFKFSTFHENGILFIIKVPKNNHIMYLKYPMTYKRDGKIYELYEFEYLLPPCTYFEVIDIQQIKFLQTHIKIIKLQVTYQDKYKFILGEKYIPLDVESNSKNIFLCEELDTFYGHLKQFNNDLRCLKKVKNQVSSQLYFFIMMNYKLIFDILKYEEFRKEIMLLRNDNKFIQNINKILDKYDAKLFFVPQNTKVSSFHMKKLIQQFNELKKSLNTFNFDMLKHIPKKMIGLTVYSYFETGDLDVIKKIMNRKYAGFIECMCSDSLAMHNNIINDFPPNIYIKKTHKLVYYKYVLKLTIKDQKCICVIPKIISNVYETNMSVLLSNYKITRVESKKNKYNLPIKIIHIALFG